MNDLRELLAKATPGVGGCLEWTGARDRYGYGCLHLRGQWLRAHRLAWELANGPVPVGKHVLHHCDNKGCINPAHLYVGTHADNMRDLRERGLGANQWTRNPKTNCKRGHPFDEANTYRYNGQRLCRACRRVAVRRYQAGAAA